VDAQREKSEREEEERYEQLLRRAKSLGLKEEAEAEEAERAA
jgi:hypothetical protein